MIGWILSDDSKKMIFVPGEIMLFLVVLSVQHVLAQDDLGGDVDVDIEALIGEGESGMQGFMERGDGIENEESFSSQSVLALQQLGVIIGQPVMKC